MKTKLFTLLLAVAASVGTMFAWDYERVQIGDLYYNLDATNQTAQVTYQLEWDNNNYKGLTSANIPASVEAYSVTSIGDRAFYYCRGLTSVTIPNSVTSIGEGAFYGCTGLTSVTIPNSVTSIGSGAFYYCSGLPVENNLRYADTYLVEAVNKTLSSYTIKEGTKWIGGSAFSGCSGLTSVTIPNSVTSIGEYAFSDCTGLTSVTIPNSVTSIGESAFYGCSGLTSVTAPAILFNDAFDIFRLEDSEMPSQIKQLTINGGELTEEGFDRIHASYRKLETIDLSAVENTEISDEAFKGCYNLKTLRLPAGLTQIGYMATAECVNLESIVIPASVEEIGDRAFEDCRSLQSITFGGANPAPGRFNAPAASASQLRRIGNWAFYNAHELQNLEIPEGVTEIGDGAFYGCTYLEEMVLPSSVQSIGDNCFALCAKLTKITCNAVTPPTIQAKTFYDVKRQIPVYVPDEAVSAYEGDTYWQEFDIQGQSEVPQGIDNTPFPSGEGRGEARKLLRDGQILILRGDKIYNAQGALVK
ncbi:MAG: leucine-rich repeat domain-containing protein [Paludibacteraceae bacterium]|nr:leucine-rich repeat domain-containing protein [Paludibacteraceae bacterium]